MKGRADLLERWRQRGSKQVCHRVVEGGTPELEAIGSNQKQSGADTGAIRSNRKQSEAARSNQKQTQEQ